MINNNNKIEEDITTINKNLNENSNSNVINDNTMNSNTNINNNVNLDDMFICDILDSWTPF